MDEAGYKLIQMSKKEKSISKIIGNILVKALPKVIKSLTVIGTIALFLVAGGIFVHYIPFFHHLVPTINLPAIIKEFVIGLAIRNCSFRNCKSNKKNIPKKERNSIKLLYI